MPSKYLFLTLIISSFFTITHGMESTNYKSNTDYNLSQILNLAPEDVWLQIIACSDAKYTIRRLCSYFHEYASTKNEQLFLQSPLVLTPEVLERFALYYADFQNNQILKNLLYHGADPNSADDYGNTLMQYATRNGNHEIINILMKHPNFNVNENIKPFRSFGMHYQETNDIHHAIVYGQITRVLFFLQHGANINEKYGPYQVTSLQIVSKHGFMKIAKLLLAYNANINAHNIKGETALLYAWNSSSHSQQIIELLLKHPDIDLTLGAQNKLFLSRIVERCHYDCFKYYYYVDILIEKTDLNEIDKSGNSPLSYAVAGKKLAMVRKLLEQPTIKINALLGKKTSDGCIDRITALDIALQSNSPGIIDLSRQRHEIINLLILHGAKTKAQLEEDGLLEKI